MKFDATFRREAPQRAKREIEASSLEEAMVKAAQVAKKIEDWEWFEEGVEEVEVLEVEGSDNGDGRNYGV